jgi:transcriptional regulator with XRE-family HTH domain
MNSLRDERINQNITQVMLEELTGITQEQISLIERGKVKPLQSTRERIEKVLGKIDWFATSPIKRFTGNYSKAERLTNKLLAITMLLDDNEVKAIEQLIIKHLKMRKVK